MPTVSQFISSVKLNKDDETLLTQHIQDCHDNASGPSLQDRCTNRVRKYLKQKPPLGLSWHGSIKLDDHLSAGFTSKEAYQMGIPAIGIVAVLVANVTFIAWSTPPGGSTPYWAGCDYPVYTSFLVVNGVAFMLSVASVIVVTAFPLVLKRTPHQAAGWGGVLLLLSMIAFVGAFVLAGFVTVAYKAPVPGCASLDCSKGGIFCYADAYTDVDAGFGYYYLDPNVAVLNNVVPADGDPFALCVRYNDSDASGAENVVLHPTTPSCPEYFEDFRDCPDVRELLENTTVQRQVVCASPAGFQSYFATDEFSSDAWSIPVNWSTLSTPTRQYTSFTDFYEDGNYITDLMNLDTGLANQTLKLVSYRDMTYKCHSNADDADSWNTLCEPTQSLSVSKQGEYITSATASTTGALVFHADKISSQLAVTVEVLSGVFGLVLLIIIGVLIKSKLK